jgi:four helix bundle protein
MDLVTEVYSVTRTFPADERFGLTSQLRRAAVSVPSNIAEGNRRPTRTEYRRFVSIARGSLAEVETQMEVARRLGFASGAKLALTDELSTRVGQMLTRLWQSPGR